MTKKILVSVLVLLLGFVLWFYREKFSFLGRIFSNDKFASHSLGVGLPYKSFSEGLKAEENGRS